MESPTVEGFLEFCRSKGTETYDYMDNYNCSFSQYLKSLGHDNPNVGGYDFVMPDGLSIGFREFCPQKFNGLGFDRVLQGNYSDWPVELAGESFDKLVKRLEFLA